MDLAKYKWNSFGFHIYFMGFMFLMVYVLVLFIYVNDIYILQLAHKQLGEQSRSTVGYQVMLYLGILYPIVYEILQMGEVGFISYFSSTTNLFNCVEIWSSIAMNIIHLIYTPYTWYSKLIIIIVILLTLRRSLAQLKIFQFLCSLCIMVQHVMIDLSVFMVFYAILLLLISLILPIMSLANINTPGAFQD